MDFILEVWFIAFNFKPMNPCSQFKFAVMIQIMYCVAECLTRHSSRGQIRLSLVWLC